MVLLLPVLTFELEPAPGRGREAGNSCTCVLTKRKHNSNKNGFWNATPEEEMWGKSQTGWQAQCTGWYSQFSHGHGRWAPGRSQSQSCKLLQAPASLVQLQAVNCKVKRIKWLCRLHVCWPYSRVQKMPTGTQAPILKKNKLSPFTDQNFSWFNPSEQTISGFANICKNPAPYLSCPPQGALPAVLLGICRATSQLAACRLFTLQ